MRVTEAGFLTLAALAAWPLGAQAQAVEIADCRGNTPPTIECRAAVVAPLDAACGWSIAADALVESVVDDDESGLRCTANVTSGPDGRVRASEVVCTDRCQASSNRCRAVIYPRDLAGPSVRARRRVARFDLGDEWVSRWNNLEDVCDVAIADNCTPGFAVVRGIIGITSDDPREQIRGEPGFFFGEGILADWGGFQLDIDRHRARSRTYTIRYAVADERRNFSEAVCEIRIDAPVEGPDLAEFARDTRWIGRLEAGDDCPEPPDFGAPTWVGRRLFSRTPVEAGLAPRPDEGAAYCLYEWIGGDGVEPMPERLPSDGGRAPTEWLDRDRHVVAALAGAGTAMADLWPTYQNAWLRQMGGLDALPTAPGVGPGPVTVAIIDSAVDSGEGTPGGGDFHHGKMMGLVVERLACPGCSRPRTPTDLLVRSYHALDLVAPEAPPVDRAGHFGLLTRLAEEIDGAVVEWKLAGAEMDSGPLVINISAGWDAIYNAADNCEGPSCPVTPGVGAVHSALVGARCAGALIIAAAGNAADGPDAIAGPMYPAAWATDPLPSECPGGAAAPADNPESPLLYAVSGVDGRDVPLANARPDAGAALVAPAASLALDNAGVAGAEIAGPAAVPPYTYTGSSIAAAAVAGVAAATWRYHPDLAPDAVVRDHLVATGVALIGDPLPDVCFGADCLEVPRRVSLCAAVNAALGAACAEAGAAPCDPAPCEIGAAYAGVALDLSADDIAALDAAVTDEDVGDDLIVEIDVEGCPDPILTVDGTPPEPPCADAEFANGNLTPWAVFPQPGAPGCPTCLFYRFKSGTGTAYLGINEKLVAPLQSPKLVFDDGTVYDLAQKFGIGASPDGLQPGKLYKIGGIPYSADATGAKLVYLTVDPDTLKPVSGSDPIVMVGP